MRQLLDAIARLRQEVPLTLETPHILLTKFDARTTLSAHVRALLRERCDAAALHTVIRVNVALARAQMARQSIFCVRSHLHRGPGLSARGGGVTREQESRGVQRPRDPVPAPEEGTRWPQRAKERASGSRRLPVAGGVSPRFRGSASLPLIHWRFRPPCFSQTSLLKPPLSCSRRAVSSERPSSHRRGASRRRHVGGSRSEGAHHVLQIRAMMASNEWESKCHHVILLALGATA